MGLKIKAWGQDQGSRAETQSWSIARGLEWIQLYWWEGVRVPSDNLAAALLTSDVTWPGNAILHWQCILYYILAIAPSQNLLCLLSFLAQNLHSHIMCSICREIQEHSHKLLPREKGSQVSNSYVLHYQTTNTGIIWQWILRDRK